MKNINHIFDIKMTEAEIHPKWSLTAQLEVFNEGYFVSGEGLNQWIKVFYQADFDGMKDSYEKLITKDYLISYLSLDMQLAFVLNEHIHHFQEDTKGYNLTYISCDSFEKEEYYCSDIELLPDEFHDICWIIDDFLYNEQLPFDFEAFELIDSGIDYLNPHHFSIRQLLNLL